MCALPYKVLPLPDSLSLAEGGTIIVAYSTAYQGLVVRGGMRPGQSVLIHSGAGAVGLAAIQISLFRGCKVLLLYILISKSPSEILAVIYDFHEPWALEL